MLTFNTSCFTLLLNSCQEEFNMDENKKDLLSVTANFTQLFSLFLLLRDASNDQIMKELQNQNTKYFEDIIKRLERIEDKINA